ncbi:MAG: glycoside hydrolase family 88 protein [Clostridia bacterium]|nr:glycoside hydrolase family 88 protein [Clostridia bacterium]
MNNYLSKENQQWVEETWNKLDKKLSKVTLRSKNKLPYSTVNGGHDNRAETDIGWWTNGFWGGLNWLMYVGTGKEIYKETAVCSEEMLDGVFDIPKRLDHDAGFIWHLTAGIDYRLTGNEQSFNRNYKAAMSLMSRFNMRGNFIRAWNTDEAKGWSIIDCMMNLPLLYWASNALKDDRFTQIAKAHADMAMQQHIRPDGSVNHIVVHNPDTGEFVESRGGQGYGVGSSWSRGCAWALYGFALSYAYTNEERYLDTAKKVAHYFISCLSLTEWLPLTDFRSPETPVLYDSTAGACAACGLLEIAKHVSEYEKRLYVDAALKILQAMEKSWCNWEENEDSILQMGMLKYDYMQQEPIIYGDYFFAEAILKLKNPKFSAW